MKRHVIFAAAACAVTLAGTSVSVSAQSVESFYKGKTVTLTIGVAAGGSYDLYGRIIGRHMSRHIPGNPNVVPKNMPGAGGILAAQRMANQAPTDGTEIATTYRGAIIMPLLGLAESFDPSKFYWLGSPGSETALCLVWHTHPVKTFEQAQKQEVIMGSTARGADLTGLLPPLVSLAGAKFKNVYGYQGGASLDLAMERGEINGRCGVSWSALSTQRADWLRDKTVTIILQLGFKPRPDLPSVPMAQEFTKTAEDKQILDLLLSPQQVAYPYFAPPGVPADRAKALRTAFMATLADSNLLAEAQKIGLELSPVTGEEIEDILKELYALPKSLIDRARTAASVNP